MAAGALVSPGAQPRRHASPQQLYSADRRGGGTPEIYFTKAIDNTRLVKTADPVRHREMKMFAAAIAVLFVLVMGYLWQHFSAIEYGYRIEALKGQRSSLVEMNAALRLEEASLKDPERIDALARQMGLQSPEAGQLVRFDAPTAEGGAPVMARATPQISVVSLTQ